MTVTWPLHGRDVTVLQAFREERAHAAAERRATESEYGAALKFDLEVRR